MPASPPVNQEVAYEITHHDMGLDMYAARRLYVKQWDHQPKEERYSVKITKGGKPVKGIKPEGISYIEEEVMYWRKANHIHAWFVENVQDDNDDCGSYYVPPTLLKELLTLCNQVIEASKLVVRAINTDAVQDKEHPNELDMSEQGKVVGDTTVAETLLPTTSGFFFGSQEYDEWYLKDIKDTRDWLVRMIDDQENGVPGDIYYSSSW